MKTASERLLILSGWISSEVVNADFVAALRSALQRGVKIWIGYGFDKGSARGQDNRSRKDWQEAEDSFEEIRKEFPGAFVYRDVGRSHEKRLICDNRFTFGGSFNLLSFSGEQRGRNKLRHEGADLIEDPDFCEELAIFTIPETVLSLTGFLDRVRLIEAICSTTTDEQALEARAICILQKQPQSIRTCKFRNS